jgi:hypothetical protein
MRFSVHRELKAICHTVAVLKIIHWADVYAEYKVNLKVKIIK